MADPLWMDPRREDAILQGERRRATQQQRARQAVTRQMAERTVALAARNPSAAPGAVVGAAVAGLDDEQADRVLQQASSMSWFERAAQGTASFITGIGSSIYEQAIKPTVRGAFTLSETLAQELVQRPLTAASAALAGDADSFGGAYRDYGNSAGVIAARNLLDDDPTTTLDLGTGFFAGGAIGEESEAQRTLTIDGQRANFGRALPTTRLVGMFVPPGNRAYNTVAGVSQFAADVLLDPLALVTGGTSAGARAAGRGARALGAADETADAIAKAVRGGVAGKVADAKKLDRSEAARALQQAGGAVDSPVRKTVLVEKAEAMFKDRDLLQKLADTDGYTFYRSVRKSSAERIDADLIRAIDEASTPEDVAEVLLRAVQDGKVNERGFYDGMGTFVRRRTSGLRFTGEAPRRTFDASDVGDAADKLEQWLNVARVDEASRKQFFDRMVRVEDNEQMLSVLHDATAAASFTGNAEEVAALSKVLRIGGDEAAEQARIYGMLASGDMIVTPFSRRRLIRQGDDLHDVPLPTPQVTAELVNQGFVLPDIVAVRRAAKRASKLEKLYTSKGMEVPASVARKVTRDFFKPAAILRPAYIVRIGLEEQARLAAAGYDSLFNHPISYIMANVRARHLNLDLTDTSLESIAETMSVMTRDATGILDRTTRRSPGGQQVWVPMEKPEQWSRAYGEAWGRELSQLAASPEIRELVKSGGDIDAFVEWARRSHHGVKTMERIAKTSPDARDILKSEDNLREWARGMLARIHDKTGGVVDPETLAVTRPGNQELLDAIADMSLLRGGDELLRKHFDLAPARVKVGAPGSGMEEARGALLDKLFDVIVGNPTSKLARYPAFRQGMVKNLTESIGDLSDDALRSEVIEKAIKNFKMTKEEVRRVREAQRAAKGTQGFIDDVEVLNDYIVERSASEVKELLFDTTRRSNAQEAYEVALPFVDAWVEVTRTWARLTRENPAFLIKAQAGFQSLQDGGVIYANDQGEQVFAYPGGGALSSLMSGTFTGGAGAGVMSMLPGEGPEAQATLEGRVQGANLVAQGVGPGFGPVVQWAVGAMPFMDDEGFREIKDFIAPFGTGGVEDAADLTDPRTYVSSLMPAWFEKTVNAFTSGKWDAHQWNSMVGDTAKALTLTGAYDPESKEKLLADARTGARFLLFTRSLTQGVGLTGASATWKVQTDAAANEVPSGWDPESDPDGVWFTMATLANEYRGLLEKSGYDEEFAATAFIEQFGIEPWYVAQAKTRSVRELPVTAEGNYWMRRHREAAERYPSVVGFFAPTVEDGQLDFSVFRAQIERGDRQSLTERQQVELANKAKAYTIYNTAKRRLQGAPSSVRSRALQQVRGALEDEFPGWQADVLGIDAKADTAARIREFELAVQDESLDDSPLTETLRAYMAARARVLAIAEQRGAGLSAAQNADLRDALADIGIEFTTRSPEFAAAWSRVFSREVEQ